MWLCKNKDLWWKYQLQLILDWKWLNSTSTQSNGSTWSVKLMDLAALSSLIYKANVGVLVQVQLGGGLLSPKSYVDVPARCWKSDFLYTNFLPNFPPISIPFSKEKHPILTKLGAFDKNLPKIHPIYVI